MEILISVVATLVIFIFIIYFAVQYGAVRASLFPVRIHQFLSPGSMGFAQEDFEVQTSDGVLISGWVTPGKGNLVVVCAHGYLVNRCQWVPISQLLVPKGATMVFFDHRGHGRSGRAKVTLGRDEKLDILAVLDYVSKLYPDKNVMLLGSSMGAVACSLAATESDQVKGLVLDAPFRSMKEASDAWWLFLAGPVAAKVMRPTAWIGPWLLGFKPEEVRVDHAFSQLSSNIPILLFFGGEDPIVSPSSAKILEQSVRGPVRAISFKGATHGAGCIQNPQTFRRELLMFIEEHKLLE